MTLFTMNKLHRKVIVLLILMSTFLRSPDLIAQNVVSNYKVFYGLCYYDNKDIVIIRKFEKLGQTFYVGIDPKEIETKIIPASQVFVDRLNFQQMLFQLRNTPYIKALLAAKYQSFSIQDAGITHGFPDEKGISLTIDLCPSHKPLDRVIFTSLISEFKKIESPVPVALSITGRFMNSHPDDLNWINDLIASNEVAITWINHTYNHYYNPHKPLINNFLLEPGTNINFEILQTEIALIEKGFLFSVFFRFPGLVSDRQVVDSVINYGLIPIGSDAWLAKGQQIHRGSIVLIHGNGNEPLGIKDFLKLLQSEKSEILKKEWLLYDLRESIEEEFKD